MDHKIEHPIKKRRQKSTTVIFVLLGVIVLMLAAGTVYYLYQQQEQKKQEELAAEKDVSTTKVKKGTLKTTLDDISGTVRSSQSVYLYWQVAGTVSNVYVETGDKVAKGEILAELDRSTIASSIIEAEVTKETAEEKLDRLYTSTLDTEKARTAMVKAKQAVKDAQDKVSSLGVVRENSTEIGAKYDDYEKAVQRYNLALETYESMKDRALDNVERQRAYSSVQSAKTAMDSALSEYNWYNGETDQLEVQQADAALKLAEAQLDDAVREYNRIKDGPTESQVKSIQAEIDSATATINTAKIVAPIDGTVAQVEAKQYDVITYESTSAARDILAVRVDDLSSHYIDITVTELEINSISLGQEVTITFDAIPLHEYSGTITNISNAGTVANLSVSYSLTVKMDETDDKIKSGMMADVAIVTKEVEDALYVPMTAIIMSTSGNRVVNKKQADGSFTEVSVQLGLSQGSDIQIISDEIAEGDEVEVKEGTPRTGAGFNMFGVTINGGGMGGPGGMPGGARPGGGAGGGGRR